MSRPSAPLYDRADLNDLIRQSVGVFNAMTPEQQREHRVLQRQSWCVGELMLSHPEMSRIEAEAIYNRVVF